MSRKTWVTERRAPEERLVVAALLSGAGAFLDAFTWLGHGGVFANAQTGNVVLLGLFAAARQWPDAIAHIPPIAAFFCGVFLAQALRRAAGHRAARVSLTVEMALLGVVAVLPRGFADWPIVVGIAFVAAFQSSSFPKVEGAAFSSVMTTGNLRRAAEALFAGLTGRADDGSLRLAAVFGTLCVTFALGAALGAFCTARLANFAVVVPMGLLLLAMVLASERRPAGTAAAV
jgi:uncharacterized membrane protein YoaK (UPF0700 family)